MNQTSTVHARLDRETKEATEAILREIGMTPTEAIRLLYRQIALRQEYPVELKIPNAITVETFRKSDKEEEIERFDSLSEMRASWTS